MGKPIDCRLAPLLATGATVRVFLALFLAGLMTTSEVFPFRRRGQRSISDSTPPSFLVFTLTRPPALEAESARELLNVPSSLQLRNNDGGRKGLIGFAILCHYDVDCTRQAQSDRASEGAREHRPNPIHT